MAESNKAPAVRWALGGFVSGLVFAVVVFLGLVFGGRLHTGARPSRDPAEPPPREPGEIAGGGSEGAPSLAAAPGESGAGSKRFINPLQQLQLSLDRPDLRASLERRDKIVIERLQRERGPGYERLFAELGLDAGRSQQLVADILQVYRARIEARKYATQLLFAQSDLERRLKLELGDRYLNYLDHEESLRAHSEATQILDFAHSGGQPGLFADKLEQLREVVIASDAYSARTKDTVAAPLDELPPPSRDAAALRYIEQEQAALSLNARNAIEMARANSFSSAEIAALDSYYQSQLGYYERSIRATADPIGAELTKLEARLAASQNSSDSRPEDIQRLARQIERLKSIKAATSPKR